MTGLTNARVKAWASAWRACGLAAVLLLSACATQITSTEDQPKSRLAFQNKALNPGNGGQVIGAEALQPDDIVLTADNGLKSSGIRLITLSPVSHAAIYLGVNPLGEHQLAEAVGEGIRTRSLREFLQEESTIVAFRHPEFNSQHLPGLNSFVLKHVGQKYNYLGVMLQAPFAIERRLCELPLVPSLVRDICIRGVGAVQLGLGRNDQFFCSQFVLEVYRSAGLPLTDADPRLISPGDLLHMREGDVPSIKIHRPLQYVGHLKTPPESTAVSQLQ